jgi:alcohol dehydrogenase class IV
LPQRDVTWLHYFEFGPTTQVVFGAGGATQTGSIARELGASRLLVMTDPPFTASA